MGDEHTEKYSGVTKLIGLLGDEDTIVGFLLGGIGQKNIVPPYNNEETNIFIVHKETASEDIEEAFHAMLKRTDIGIIFITRLVADKIRHTLNMRDRVYPIVLEIPSGIDPFNDQISEEEQKQCQRNQPTTQKKK